MSANIEEKDGKASMFYFGDTPWHGLGIKVNRALTAEEALDEAKLNYQVSTKEIQTTDGILVPNRLATYRTDVDGSDGILGVVGKNYKVIQNADMLGVFDPLIERNEAIYHTAGVIGKGERIWLLAKLPESMKIGNEDIIDKYILLMNTHNGQESALVKFVATRVVCENTLMFSLKEQSLQSKIRHIGDVKHKIETAYEILGITRNYFNTVEEQINRMAVKDITSEQLLDYVNMVLGIKEDKTSTIAINKRDTILQLCESGKGSDLSGGTLWGGLNGVTEYFDHHTTPKNNNRMGYMFGTGEMFKQKAWNLAVDLLNN